MSDSFSRAKEAADRYKNYQSTSSSEGWGGSEKKGNDSYIGPNELKAMQRDSGLSANEMNDFFSSEEGQQYFNKNHRSGGSPTSGADNSSSYLAAQAQAETNASNYKTDTQNSNNNNNTEDSYNTEDSHNTTDSNNTTDSYNDDVSGQATNETTSSVDNRNPQKSSIKGDNNSVYQQQDNSSRTYGGSTRNFVYNGGGNEGGGSNGGYDSPASMATMAGFYDVDDSAGAQAKFNDFYNTSNNDAQKRFAGSGMAVANMFKNYDARSFNPTKLQTRIDQSTIRSDDQATVKDNDVFGDRDLSKGTLPTYEFGAAPKAVGDKDDDDDDD